MFKLKFKSIHFIIQVLMCYHAMLPSHLLPFLHRPAHLSDLCFQNSSIPRPVLQLLVNRILSVTRKELSILQGAVLNRQSLFFHFSCDCFSFNLKFKTFLTASPLYWLSGLIFFISSAFQNYKVVFSNSTKPSDNLRLLQKYQVSDCIIRVPDKILHTLSESLTVKVSTSSLQQVHRYRLWRSDGGRRKGETD